MLSLEPGVSALDCAASACGVVECARFAFFRGGILIPGAVVEVKKGANVVEQSIEVAKGWS